MPHDALEHLFDVKALLGVHMLVVAILQIFEDLHVADRSSRFLQICT
jgi:hypothetical protein